MLIFVVSFSSFMQLKPYFLNSVPDYLYSQNITLTGRVSDYSEESIYPKSFVVNNLIINGTRYSGNLKVYTDQDFPPPFSTVTIEGTINKVYLKTDIETLTSSAYYMFSNKITVNKALGFSYTLNKLRLKIVDSIKLSMKSDEAFLLLSSIMGIYALSNEERAPFDKTGTAHIFAVSGLHMSILGETLNNLLGNFFILSPLISLIVLLMFTSLIGLKVSALRAVLMYAIFTLAQISGREPNNLNVLGFAGLVVLIFSPLSIFSISFQLSFMSIFALFVFAPFVSKSLPDKLVCKILAATISIQIFLLPFISFYFGTFSISSFIANLFAIPYMSILVPAGLAQVIASFWGSQIPIILGKVSNFLYGTLNSAIIFISKLPLSYLNLKFSFISIILFFLILIFLLLLLKHRRKILLLTVAILVSAFLFSGLLFRGFLIHPYKLGGENFFIIRDASSTTILFFRNLDMQMSNMSSTLEKELKLEGINNIDLIVITYPIDNENYSNALELAKIGNFRIQNIMLQNPDEELINIFLEQTKNKIHLTNIQKNSTIKIRNCLLKSFSESNNSAILLNRNGKDYLLVGSSRFLESQIKTHLKIDETYLPDDFELNSLKDQIEFGKIYKY